MNEMQYQWTFSQRMQQPMMKLVLLNLSFHAERDEFVCPPIETISDETQLDQEEVQGYLAELKKQGYLKATEEGRGRLVFVRAA